MRDVCIIRYGPILPSLSYQCKCSQNCVHSQRSRSTTQKGTLFGNSIDPYTLFRGSRRLRTQVLFRRVWGQLLSLGHLRVYSVSYCSLLFSQYSMSYQPSERRGGEGRRDMRRKKRKLTSAQRSHTGNQIQMPSS
jgi:hypothetical protein